MQRKNIEFKVYTCKYQSSCQRLPLLWTNVLIKELQINILKITKSSIGTALGLWKQKLKILKLIIIANY